MDAKLKQWGGLTLVAVLGILAGSWFLLVSPKHSQAASLKTQTSAEDTANSQLQVTLSQLKAQAKDLPAQQAKLAAVAAKIPGATQLPTLIRSLQKSADTAGVELVTIAPQTAAPVAGAAAPAATTGTVSAAGAPAAAAPTGNFGTLMQVPVNMNIAGSYFEVTQFLNNLELLQRAFKVTNVSLSPGANPLDPSSAALAATGGSLTASISGLTYEAPGRATATSSTTTGK